MRIFQIGPGSTELFDAADVLARMNRGFSIDGSVRIVLLGRLSSVVYTMSQLDGEPTFAVDTSLHLCASLD